MPRVYLTLLVVAARDLVIGLLQTRGLLWNLGFAEEILFRTGEVNA
jgi:hypothetical protein